MVQRKLLSSSVLVVRAGGIGPTLLLLLASSGVVRSTVLNHDDTEVSKLHWQFIHTERRMKRLTVRPVGHIVVRRDDNCIYSSAPHRPLKDEGLATPLMLMALSAPDASRS